MSEFQPGRGLDIGTSFIIGSRQYATEDKVMYTEFRDAFFRLQPTSPIAKKMMAKGLKGQQYFEDVDGSYIVVGQDAIERAIERNSSANRPLVRGVIAPREKQARRILRHIFKETLGDALTPGEKLVYSVPAQPVDQNAEDFDVGFHTDAINNDLRALGYTPSPLSEAEAICYSELEADDYTGICLSFGAGMVNVCLMSAGEGILHWSTTRCLEKNYLISTQRGLIPIKKVTTQDLVIDNHGQHTEVLQVLNNGQRESLTSLSVEGYSESLNMTHDHRVWTKKGGSVNWQWIEAQDIKKGDRLGVPIIKPSDSTKVYKSMYLGFQNGSPVRSKGSTRNLGRFLGFFLGDGNSHIVKSNPSDGRISISFDTTKPKWTFDQQTARIAIEDIFGISPSYENREEDHCSLLKFWSKDIANRLNTLCYDNENNKALRWSTSKIGHQLALGIIEGVLKSDGYKTSGKYCLEITSSQVALLWQDLLARFGIRTTFSIREPRAGGINRKGQQIVGKKQIYRVEIGHDVDNATLDYLMTLKPSVNLPITSMDYIERKVISSKVLDYDDDVFDLVVASDHHCFSSPGGVVHNSGDWVDRMAAQATASPDTVVQVEKEHSQFQIGQEIPSNPILSAVSLYYVRLIDYTVQHLIARLSQAADLPNFTTALSIVVAGGTSQAEGFVEQFQKCLSERNPEGAMLPFEVKEVRAASNKLRAVSRGCLLAAQL